MFQRAVLSIAFALIATALPSAFLSCSAGTASYEAEIGTQPLDEDGEPRPDQPLAAAMMRYVQRLSGDGTIPPNALLTAKRQRDALLAAGAIPSGDAREWEWLGPGNIGGRIRAIVIHPQQPEIMWIGSASGGIWKTTDAGQSWMPLDDFLPSMAIGCMVMHPENPDVLFAGTGEGFFETVEGTSNTAAVRGAGIFKTIDGGATWQQIPSTAGDDWHFVNRLAFSPDDPDVMLAATNAGIFRSTDGGASWSLRAAFQALDVKFSPSDGTRAVAGGHHEEDGPYSSVDGGLTWQQATGAGGHRQEMAYAPSNPSVVYAAVSDTGSIRVWRSFDGGATYSLRTAGGGPTTYASYNSTIWVDPGNPQTLIVGGVRLHRSLDGGVGFSTVFNAVHADHHAIVAHPQYNGSTNRVLFFGCDGGIYRTSDALGNSAVALNNNLGITQFYGAAINAESGVVLGGTQDNGTLRFGGDPDDWLHMFGGDGGYCAADPTDPDYMYGETQWARIFRSVNGGLSGQYIYAGPNPIQDALNGRTNFIPYFMLDPNDPNTMLVAGERLWRSRNVKASQPDWFAIRESRRPPGPPRGGGQNHFAGNPPWTISTIAVAEGDSDLVWVGQNDGEVWFTQNGTANQPAWTRVDENGPGLPDRWISRIVIDPNDHDRIYVAVMGWEPDNLWLSEDRGQSWRLIAGSGDSALPSVPISALAVHPSDPGHLSIGTDIGMFASEDDGATWAVIDAGPGTAPVEELIWRDPSTLMAVSHGRGIYLGLDCTPGPDCNRNGIADFCDILAGTSDDCNGNDVPDECDIASGTSPDENLNGIPDECEQVVLELLAVRAGRQVGGTIDDLAESDDQYLIVEQRLPATPLLPYVSVDVQGRAVPDSASALTVLVEAAATALPPAAPQQIELFDFDLGRFELIDERPATLDDSEVEILIDENAGRFLGDDSIVYTRLNWFAPDDPLFTSWSVRIDRVAWWVIP